MNPPSQDPKYFKRPLCVTPSTDEPFVAIDFGSTNSVAFLYKNGRKELLREGYKQDSLSFPSIVQYTVDNEGKEVVYTGSIVEKSLKRGHAPYVVKCVKRMIGLSYEEFEKLENKDIFGCEVFEKDGKPFFKTSENDTVGKSGEEVASEIFKAIKVEADKLLGFNQDCVNKQSFIDYKRMNCYVTVPANYMEHQREAIKKSAAMAGFDVMAIFSEPTAAAMSWCCKGENLNKIKRDEKMLVFDFGGGTLDISVIRYEGDMKFKVLTTGGNPRLGGEDVDTYIAQSLLSDSSICVRKAYRPGGKKYSSFVSMCEEAKINLATMKCTFISGDICQDDNEYEITSSQLDNLVKSKLEKKIKDCVDKILQRDLPQRIRLSRGVIRHIFMVGGSSQLLAVKNIVRSMFGLPSQAFHDVDPRNAVAQGAMNLAIKLRGGRANDITECINYSYGLYAGNDQVAIQLYKNSPFSSTSASLSYRTTYDYPEYIESQIYQWEGDPVIPKGQQCLIVPRSECKLVKTYKFKNPDPKPKGEQTFNIEFHIEYGGTLEVTCSDPNTKKLLNSQSFRGLISSQFH